MSPRLWALLASASIACLSACGEGEPVASTAASTDATASPSSSPTLIATPLPGGLDERPLLPDLVDGEAAACIPTCGAGRVAGGELPAGLYQTKVFFGGYMTVESDGSWPLSEDSNGELSLLVSDNYRIAFMLDIQLVTDDLMATVIIPGHPTREVVW